MTVDGQAERLRTEADEPGWEVDPYDEWGVAVIATVGRQLRLRREAAGVRASDFGRAVGYGEDMVYKIEAGRGVAGPRRATPGRDMIHETVPGNSTEPAWFKSSYSSSGDGESCVEIATAPRTVHVRDSKNTKGPTLALSSAAWTGFLPYAAR